VEGTVQSAGLKERRLINYKGSAKRGTAGVNNLVNNFPVGKPETPVTPVYMMSRERPEMYSDHAAKALHGSNIPPAPECLQGG
jgi:hypothetical protein